MGHVYQDVVLTSARKKKVRMLVDTGATFSLISSALAKELGIKPLPGKVRVELADGSIVSQKAGSVMVRIDDREAPATVLIGRNVEPLLGVETLEALGLAVDPSSEELIPTRSFTVRLGGYRGSPR